MPKRCEKDLHEIPENNLEGIEFVFAQRIEEVLESALTSKPKPKGRRPVRRPPPGHLRKLQPTRHPYVGI